MKALLSAVATLCIAASPARANITIVITSIGCELGLTSQGTGIDTSYVFSLGTFDAGFNPLATNISEWSSHFNDIADGGWGNDTADSGIANTGFFAIEYVGTYDGSGASIGQQAYVWGYNPEKTQMILLTNSSWLLPDPTTLPPINWLRSTYDQGTQAVFGTLNAPSGGTDPYLMTAEVVPEPSAFVLAGLGLAGIIAARRRLR